MTTLPGNNTKRVTRNSLRRCLSGAIGGLSVAILAAACVSTSPEPVAKPEITTTWTSITPPNAKPGADKLSSTVVWRSPWGGREWNVPADWLVKRTGAREITFEYLKGDATVTMAWQNTDWASLGLNAADTVKALRWWQSPESRKSAAQKIARINDQLQEARRRQSLVSQSTHTGPAGTYLEELVRMPGTSEQAFKVGVTLTGRDETLTTKFYRHQSIGDNNTAVKDGEYLMKQARLMFNYTEEELRKWNTKPKANTSSERKVAPVQQITAPTHEKSQGNVK